MAPSHLFKFALVALALALPRHEEVLKATHQDVDAVADHADKDDPHDDDIG